MNLKEYISSGILEAYALGELSERERHSVEHYLDIHPELKNELRAIEEATESLIARAGQSPSNKVKASVLRSLQVLGKKEFVISARAPVVLWKYATAASLVIAIATSALAYVYWSNWKRTKTDLEERVALSRRMAEDFDAVNQRLDKIESDLEVYDNPLFKKIVMKGTANAPSAMASLYWNQATHELFLSIQNLKELTQDKQYQLWAMVDGRPVDMGVFDSGSVGLIQMIGTSNASAFAITIEPRGGKPVPTLETIQVSGST